jgi:16S rRNA (cytosine1402-N4)-methyltransferase
LQSFPNFLISGGRCLVMTYHSWEDRMVKYAFKELVEQWIWTLVNKKVITPERTEVKKNKAARSAKLRIFEKI